MVGCGYRNKARNQCAKEDLYYPHPWFQDLLWWGCTKAEKFLVGSTVRKWALKEVLVISFCVHRECTAQGRISFRCFPIPDPLSIPGTYKIWWVSPIASKRNCERCFHSMRDGLSGLWRIGPTPYQLVCPTRLGCMSSAYCLACPVCVHV